MKRGVDDLGSREVEVLRLMAKGLSNAEVASELTLAVDTVKSHAGRMFSKLGARNRAHAVAIGVELGVIDLGFCCDKWWKGLSEKQREYVHYYFYDIVDKSDHLSHLSGDEVHKMHESKCVLERRT